MINFEKLIKAGVHFGHQKTRWCPKMAPYIWGFKNDIHLIDVSKTAIQLEKAAKFLHDIAAEGKQILWVGTKKSARDGIVHYASALKMPYVSHRWIGGTLSNHGQVKKSVTKLLHFEDVLAKSDRFPHYTKKEFNVFAKMVERLVKNVGGIRNLVWPLGAIVLVDVSKERSALKEASIMGVPVVALVDTNGDPTHVDYVIPANDDAPRAVSVLLEYLSEATAKGIEKSKQKPAKVIAAQEEQQEPLLVLGGEADEEEENEVRAAGRGAKKKSDEASAVLDAVAKVAVKKPTVSKAPEKTAGSKIKPNVSASSKKESGKAPIKKTAE